jgi:hypothetical protein
MSFAANLSRARSHLIIVFGLISASALIMTIEANQPSRVSSAAAQSDAAPTRAQQRAAAWAWAHLTPAQRSVEMREAAARLGVQDTKASRLGPDEAAAILRALDQSRGAGL